ncbi:AmmeMemoRadiSam system protein A [Wukongibacter baidiensis]|uniref:AmmeMemoRadiSam system protein A n=1 Tax=Wukongibacter baidiensis TaxID=1723361 RepID=UPI003D7F81DB
MGKILAGYLMPHPPIILREIGKGKEKEIQSTIDGMEEVARNIKEKMPKTIILITPHGPVFSDAIAISIKSQLEGNMAGFGAEQVKIVKDNDLELANRIIKYANKMDIPCAMVDDEFAKEYNISTELDHGTMVPLYFVDKEYIHYRLIHITYGLLPNEDLYSFGKSIQEAVEEGEENVVVIASGDLSHKLKEDGPYGYNSAGPEYDNLIINLIENLEVEKIIDIDRSLCEEAGECGMRSIDIMLGSCDGYKISSEVISYEGPFGVGYGVAKLEMQNRDRDRQLLDKLYKTRKDKIAEIRRGEDEYVKLARESLEHYIKSGNVINTPKEISEELINDKKGVFVSLKKDGTLRGCIGTIKATTENIAREIIENAIKAGTEDPRFFPVEEEELEYLTYSVDVLMSPEPIKSFDDLDVNKYGIIVSLNERRGLLLPNLEGVDTVEEQVRIALGKAGIAANEGYNIQRFEVIRHK